MLLNKITWWRFLILAIAAALLVPGVFVHAEVAPTSTATSTATSVSAPVDPCAITSDDLATIQAIQNNPNLNYDSELSQELTARKALLTKTLTCAENQVASLRIRLSKASASGIEAQSIASQLGSRLDDAQNYYQLENAKLAGAGISGTEQVAKEVLAWRSGSFVPLENQIDNFLVWSSNQPLFDAAQSRVTQIGQVVSFFSSANSPDLESSFSAAQTSFQTAEQQNIAAEQGLAQSLPGADVAASIQQSLQSLAAAYQNLFTVSTIVQNLVPQPSQ